MSELPLRREFDQSFALPPPQAAEELEDLLAIRVAGDPYAIRLRDVAGMVAGGKVVPVPSAARDLLGLTGIRGAIVPVFALGPILGYGQASGEPRWMVLCGEGEGEILALAFSDFDGYVRLPRTSLQVASTEAGARPIIGIPEIVSSLRNRIGPVRASKEQ